jgi:thioredoxin 1
VSDNLVHTNDGNFDADVINAEKPALVDFWAEWCGPCKMIAPFLDEAATEYADKLSVVKLNVDESPNVAAKFGIRSIPTLMLFKDGAVQAQKVGAFSKSQLTEFLDSNL